MKKCVGAAAIALAVVLAVAAFGRARNIGKVIVSQENVDSFLAPLLFQLNSSLTEKKSNNTTSDVSLDENDESAKVKSTQLGRPNTEVKRHHFPMNLVNFLHIGKAGGGTIAVRIRQVWKLRIHQCHPWPCINQKRKRRPWIVISLRDPVERFVSAFYWRILKLCHPEVDKRPNGRPTHLPSCFTDKFPHKNETMVLFYRYNQSASMLAEELCSANEATARLARESLGAILHAQHDIQDWLAFKWKGESIFPIVLEDGAQDLEEQIDESVHWIYNVTRFQSDVDFAHRAANVKMKKHHTNVHTGGAKQTLSLEGEKCLERFYRRDYQLLQQLLDTACKTPGCRGAIKSILDRRQRAFEGPPVANTTIPVDLCCATGLC